MSGSAAPGLGETIREDIAGRILSGAWPPGHRIPVEHELMARYGCSRMTVNKALSTLVAEGLIERRRRAGSFVSRPRSQSAVLDIPDVRAEVQALGLPWSMEVLKRTARRATTRDRTRLGEGAGERVLVLSCRHRAGPRIHALEDRVIDLSAVPEAEHGNFDGGPPGSWLLSHVPLVASRAPASAPGGGRRDSGAARRAGGGRLSRGGASHLARRPSGNGRTHGASRRGLQPRRALHAGLLNLSARRARPSRRAARAAASA